MAGDPTQSGEPPLVDPDEAAAAAASDPKDPRRPRLVPVDGEPLTLEQLATRIRDRYPQVDPDIRHGELTVHVAPDDVVDVLTFCRDDEDLSLRLLSDLSGAHWPAGDHVIERQPSTTGWPEYRVSRERGVVEVLYVLRSLQRNHWLRVSVGVDDADPVLPSATPVYPAADYPEREVYDFFGVRFEGHHNLTRILMPEDWVGHPLRKDYPLGGVDIQYEHDKFIPSPERRDLREVVRGDGPPGADRGQA